MKIKLLFVAALLSTFGGTTASAGLTAKSLEALKNYCIPSKATPSPDNDWCDSIFYAVSYLKKGDCRCKNNEYLVWDANLRRCKPKCPGGFFVQHQTSGRCTGGQFKKRIIQNVTK